ncbi:transposase [Patescibacteria group bacterium]|nr:transposase [Patescibacteria group bacterium]MBU4016844.1 transposase [Patescibacteria group bacterium]MBU4099079.1 transposase [Patescibacteria group bacterium]
MQYSVVNRRERKLNRLQKYDYSQNGYYFITVCAKGKIEYFGKIENGKMILNEYGKIVKQQWLWLAKQYNYVNLDEFIIMPNHLHGIIVVGTGRDLSLRYEMPDKPKIKSLSELMGAFKTTSSKLIHRNGLPEFQWQRSFYDHIIHDEKSLEKIREYIANNPLKWDFDRNNQDNLYN